MSFPISGPRISVTELQRSDLPQALQVYNSNAQFNEWSNGFTAFSLEALTKEYDEMRSIPTGHWLAIHYDEDLVGIAHILLENPNDGKSWIGLLLIKQEQQGKGLGREAVECLENYIRSHGKDQVRVGVIVHNLPALLFWGKLGYEQYRQTEAPVGRLTQPVMLMAKQL